MVCIPHPDVNYLANIPIALPHNEVESSEFYKHIECEGNARTAADEATSYVVWCTGVR